MGALAEAARGAAENKALLSYRSRFNAMHDLEEVAEEIFLAERLDSLKITTENLDRKSVV